MRHKPSVHECGVNGGVSVYFRQMLDKSALGRDLTLSCPIRLNTQNSSWNPTSSGP